MKKYRCIITLNSQLINSMQRKKHFTFNFSLNERKGGNKNGYLVEAEKVRDDDFRNAIVGRNDIGNIKILKLRRRSGGRGDGEATRRSKRKY